MKTLSTRCVPVVGCLRHSGQRSECFQRPARLHLDRRRLELASLQPQRAGERDHRAIVGAEFEARKMYLESLARASVGQLPALMAVRADTAGDDERASAG